jgi:hypothetical protein
VNRRIISDDDNGPKSSVSHNGRVRITTFCCHSYPEPKEVTWTGTTSEKAVKTTEIRLFPVKYQIAAHLSVSTVLKTTMKMFLASDPAFHLVSRSNANAIIKNVAELDQLSHQKLKSLFPAKMINGKATLRLFAASDN